MVDDNSVVNCGGTVPEQLFGKTHRFSDCRWEKSQASNQNLISLNIVVDPRGVGEQHSSGRGIPTLFPSRPQLRFCPHPVELLSSPGRRQLPTCPPAMSPPSSWASSAAAALLLLPSLQGPQVQFFPSFWYEKRATLCCSSLSALYAAYIQFISSTSWIFHCWSGLWVTLPWSCLLICVPTVSLKCIVFQSLHIPTKCLSSPMIGANLCPPKLTDSNQPKIILTWMILSMSLGQRCW